MDRRGLWNARVGVWESRDRGEEEFGWTGLGEGGFGVVFSRLIKWGFRISLWLSGPVSASMDIRVSLRRPSRLLFHTFFLVHLEGWFENPPSNTAFLYGSPLDSGNYEELTSEITVMLHRFCGRTRQFRKVGTAEECLYTPGMLRKPRACIDVTWSFKN